MAGYIHNICDTSGILPIGLMRVRKQVDLFPTELMAELEDLSRTFIS